MADSKRIAVLGMMLESNAFSPPTTKQDYEKRCYLEGDDILAELARDAPRLPAEIDGFFAGMAETGLDWEAIPVVAADAEPGGPVDQAFFEATLAEMRRRLVAAGPLDGVYVNSHGAMRATGSFDPDGDLYEMIRGVVGDEVPLVATLDLHANVSARMVDLADVLIAYRTNPHVDQAERAAEAAHAMAEMLAGMRPATAFVKVPIAAPTVTLLTAEGPYAELIAYGQQAMTPALLNVSVVAGFIYSDSPKCGMSVIVTSRGDQAAARALAADIADRAWAMHERFQKKLTPVSTAVAMAVANGTEADRPAQIFADVADNPGGGGTGATTALLAALVEAGVDGAVVGVLCDPALAEHAYDAGEGAKFTAVFNEVPTTEFDERFEAQAEVLKLSTGSVVGRRGMFAGRSLDIGPSALLRIGGVRVVVATNRKQCADPAMLEIFGINIAEVRTVVVKSRGHFRAGFDEFFGPDQVVEVDCPGLTSPMLGNFPWRDLVRPVFPLDQDTTWDGAPW